MIIRLFYQIIEKMQQHRFGTFLRNKRKKAGISLNKFAVENFIESATLSRIETNKQDIKLQTLLQIANGFDITASELLKEFENFTTLY